MPNERHITRAAQALAMGVEVSDLHDTLIAEGLTEYEVFLCVKAAELLNSHSTEVST